MQDYKGKRLNYQNKTFVIQSVLVLKNGYSILGFYEKDGAIPAHSHIVEIRLEISEFMRLLI
jgi:hypothetical protein